MEFWSRIAGLVRRKRVIIPVVLFAATLAVVAYTNTPTSYVSSSTMVLTTTQFGGTESQDPANPTALTNPMLNFNESLTTTSAILIQAMNTKDVEAQLGVEGPTTLVVDDGRSNPNLLGLNGPFLYIQGTSTSPRTAENIVVAARKLLEEKLRQAQVALNAPAKTYISLVDVVAPTSPVATHARATKHALMAFIFGLLVSMTIAYSRDRAAARRRLSAAAAGQAGHTPAAADGRRPGRRHGRRWGPSRSPLRAGAVEAETFGPTPDSTPVDDMPAPAFVLTSLKRSEPALVPAAEPKKTGPDPLPSSLRVKLRSRNS